MEKKSLIAEFDDLCRSAAVLTAGNEPDFIQVLLNQEECRLKWKTCESELQQMHALYQKVNADKAALENNLAHARSMLEHELKKRCAVEKERDSLARVVDLMREVLTSDRNAMNDQTREKFAFLNEVEHLNGGLLDSPRRLNTIDESSSSLLSSGDISYDRTDDNIDVPEGGMVRTHRGERKSSAAAPTTRLSDGSKRAAASKSKDTTPPKRVRTSQELSGPGSIVTTTTVEMSKDGPLTAHACIETRAMKRRSSGTGGASAAASTTTDNNTATPAVRRAPTRPEAVGSSSAHQGRSSLTPATPNSWTPLRSQSSTKLNSRVHDFVVKTVIVPETCWPCNKKVRFAKQALKCKDCRSVCHPECRDQVPLPCVPATYTPGNGKGAMGSIADYTPLTLPMVPAVVVHCVNEVEARGLQETGIYRIPGVENEVKDLKDKFLRGRGVPKLSSLDIHVVCGCLKDFLRSLKEPIITNTAWKDFVAAAELIDHQDALTRTYQAISELPLPNRDTLAYMIMHLQRVAESPACKMPASNLAKIFGPTIVGYSTSDPEPAVMLLETRKQAAVMESLMRVPADYWNNFVDVEESFSFPPIIQDTPKGAKYKRPSNSSERTMSTNGRRRSYMTHGPLPPRENYHTLRSTSTNYFTSPMLK